MHETLQTIRRITDSVADSDRPVNSFVPEMIEYALLLRQTLLAARSEFIRQRDIHDPTILNVGEAISPWHAAASMEDRTRTAAFIRGSVRAVEFALATRQERPLHLLEAGCGPLGTLVVPLLARFGPDELEVTLVDLHQESIDCVCQVLESIGLSDRIRQAVCGDIIQMELDSKVHVALSETMYVALSSEPQVEIARALVRQHPDAILLPQSIQVRLTLIDWAAEQQSFPLQVRDRIDLGLVFELNPTTASELSETDGRLPAARLRIPALEPRHVPFLTTTVEVFEGVRFADYDAEITTPVPLTVGKNGLNPGDVLQFAYRLGESPGLEWTIVDS